VDSRAELGEGDDADPHQIRESTGKLY
jgi:hypothetical protein